MRPINRITPALPAAAYKTYTLSAPLSTHWRPGTCEEADCQAYRNGWITRVDETTELGQKQAYHIRKMAGRRFREQREPAGLTAFVFEAGQACFTQHQVPLERDVRYLVQGGDWRGNPQQTGTRVHKRGEDWLNDFAEHQDKLKTTLERG